MKTIHFFLATALLATSLPSCAQDKQSRPSPAAKATGKAGKATITIDYSSPAVKGRKIFGDLLPYGKIWRAGANEATIFEVDSDVKVEGQSLPKGKYGFFAIPGEGEWTVVFNKTWNQWGSYRYKQEEDALRVKVAAKKTSQLVENLVYAVENGKVILRWENTEVSIRME
ncbi:MAG: DUF2911 domain-containing protein [Bacteroidetes bacterium]|nr:DUF2911 domain-containing protein [Bacteroidota bacterium]